MPEERFYRDETIGEYTLEKRIGIGGMGEVWKATRPSGPPVAIKFAHRQLENEAHFREFALQEANTNLVHPNIVGVEKTFEVDGFPAIVFYYVEGPNLETEIYAGSASEDVGQPLAIPRAIQISCDVLSALDFAHQKGLVHRDVKSSNILLERATQKALLSDFGLVMDVTVRRMTRYGMMGGSVPYMSPEQIRDNRSVDLRSDIYSFGVVLYEALTGVLPFRVEPGETEDPDYLIKHKHRYNMAVPPSTLNPLVSAGLDRAVLRALAKDRDQRFQNCPEFIASLRDLTAEPRRKIVELPDEMPGPELPPPHPAYEPEDREVLFRAGTFTLTGSQVRLYLPWVLMWFSAFIVLISLYLHFFR